MKPTKSNIMKSMIRTITICICCLLAASGLHAQTPTVKWYDLFGGTNATSPNAGGHRIIPAIGGGYLAVGTTIATDIPGGKGGQDAWAVKYDEEGLIVWKKAFGGTAADLFSGVRQTLDGKGYVFYGRTSSNDGDVSGNHGSWDAWVVCTDDTGRIIWQHCYGGAGSDGIYALSDVRGGSRQVLLEPLDKGGFILSAPMISTDGDVSGIHGLRDLWVARLDDTGAIKWSKCYGGSGNDYCTGKINVMPDGGFVIGGGTESNDGDVTGYQGAGDFWIIKLDSVGTLEWQKTMGGSGIERGYAGACLAPDGGYVLAGTSQSADGDVIPLPGGTAYANWWVVKLSSTGSIVWNRSLGNVGQYSVDIAHALIPAIGGGYLLGGSVQGATASGAAIGDSATIKGPIDYSEDFWLVKLHENGTLDWEQNYYTPGKVNWEQIRDVYENPDGSIMVTGGHTYNTWWTAKLFACPAYKRLSDTICKGQSVVFNGQILHLAGTYADTLLMANTGCDSFLYYTLVVDSVIKPLITATGTTLSIGSYAAYQWLDAAGNPIPSATGVSYMPTASGIYRVAVFNARGCSDTSDAYMYTAVGIKEQYPRGNFNLYPNPGAGKLQLDLENASGTVVITISSIDGRRVAGYTGSGNSHQLDVSGLQPGMYFIKMKTADAETQQKFIRQ
jgi:hypothetical protein